jgi:DNA repair exonuclease SbcCD ATPase subunit
MKPIKLIIRGFGPHAETVIDYESLRSPLVICGPFGSGKTFLLEGPSAALYSQFCWYPGSLYDAMTQGGDGRAEIEFQFFEGGALYRVRRELRDTGKTKTQRAWMERGTLNDGWQPIAGPNVKDVEREVTARVGDMETACATWLVAQNRRGDLIGQPGEPDLVARRRSVFNALIGADALDALEKRCGEQQSKARAVADELDAQLAGTRDYETELIGTRALRAKTNDDIGAAHDALQNADTALESARQRLRDAQGDDATLNAQIELYQSAAREERAIEARVAALRRDVDALAVRAEGQDALMADCESLAALRAERAALDRQRNAYLERQNWQRRRDEVGAQIDATRREIAALESQPGADAEAVALAGRANELLEQGRAAKAENDARKERNKYRDNKRSSIGLSIGRMRGFIDQNRRRLASKPETPFGDQCSPCPLMREWAMLPADIDAHEQEIAKREAELAAIEPDEALIDLAELRADCERALAARAAVEAAPQARERLVVLRAELAAAERAQNEHCDRAPDPVEDPSPRLAEVQRDMDLHAGAPERLKAAQQAAQDLAARRIELDQARALLAEAEADVERLAPAAESARAALADRERQRETLQAAVTAAVNAQIEARGKLDSLNAERARLEERITSLERQCDETMEKRERARALRADVNALTDLRQCFGPRGVRQILMDAAAPALEAIADDLFERATGGRMRLRIATQTVNADGSTREDFQIMIRSESGERDALRFSGGQLNLIQIVFRLAVALWIAEIQGRSAECLFLDEAFDRLGADGTEDLLRVLEYLGNRIALIVVVTHDPAIAARMPGCVRVVRTLAGATVETNE